MLKKVLVFLSFIMLLLASSPPLYAISKTTTIALIEDTYVEELFPSISPWNNRNIYLGKDKLYNKGKTRFYAKADLEKLQQLRVSPQKITSATLRITSYVYQGTKTTMEIVPYQVLSGWNMYSITWNNQPTLVKKFTEFTIPTQNGQKSINLQELLLSNYKSLLEQGTNYGFSFRLLSEDNLGFVLWGTGCEFAPNEPRCNQGDEPVIELTYEENNFPAQCSINSPQGNTIINSQNVNFSLNPGTDPDGDSLLYKVRACLDENCSQQLETPFSSSLAQTLSLPDNHYYIQCIASDGIEVATSPFLEITIDSSAPEAPLLSEEPQYTAGDTNTLVWNTLEQDVSFQIQWSTSSVFTTNNVSEWILSNFYTVNDLEEKKYYFRVRSKDTAGNISQWSNVVSSTQDTQLPKIEYFKSNRLIASPKVDADNQIINDFYIQGRFEDKNLNSVSLEIYNSKKEKVFSTITQDKQYIWLHWPQNATEIKDDTYVVYFFAEDKSGHLSISDGMQITIDTMAPPEAVVTNITEGMNTNKTKVSSLIKCKESTYGKTYLNNRIVGEFVTTHNVNFELKDNEYSLKVLCRDAADNESIKEIRFTIDTTPPQAPSISVEKENNRLVITTKCREKGKVKFLINGNEELIKDCQESLAQEWILNADEYPFNLVFSAQSSDVIGNWSDSKLIEFDNTPEVPKTKTEEIDCRFHYLLDEKRFTQKDCDWNLLAQDYLKAYSARDEAERRTLVALGNYNIKANVYLSVEICKAKDFWNPFTWFGCVGKEIETRKISMTLIPRITFNNTVVPYSRLLTGFYEFNFIVGKDTSLIKPQYYFYSGKLVTISNKDIDIYIQSPDFTSNLQFSNAKEVNSKALRWPLEKLAAVSQWHGYTAYEKPHGGIDISVAKAQIVVPADGVVVSKSYHQSTPCFGGGYYIAIKHDSGIYTYYFHLANDSGPNVGTKVSKGQKLAISGNSGLYNCEKLGYHLHFETRTSQKPADHINPVPLIEVDWSQIPTSKASVYPGRLSGDNPHPKY